MTTSHRRYPLGFDTAATVAGAFIGLFYSPLVMAAVFLVAFGVVGVDGYNTPSYALWGPIAVSVLVGAVAMSIKSYREEQFLEAAARRYASSS